VTASGTHQPSRATAKRLAIKRASDQDRAGLFLVEELEHFSAFQSARVHQRVEAALLVWSWNGFFGLDPNSNAFPHSLTGG